MDAMMIGFLRMCFLEDVGALLWCWVDFEYASTQYQHWTIFALVEIGMFEPGRTYFIHMIVPLAGEGMRIKYT